MKYDSLRQMAAHTKSSLSPTVKFDHFDDVIKITVGINRHTEIITICFFTVQIESNVGLIYKRSECLL